MIKNLLWVFFISMLPIVELRGGLPAGYFLGLPWQANFLVSIVGNLLPVPFILWLIPYVLSFMEKHRIFPRIVGWVQKKARRGAAKLEASQAGDLEEKRKFPWATCLALFAFVAVPLPGTGAWTGALIAATFGMKKRYALPTIVLGVLTAGAVICVIFYGGVTALQGLF